jgi:hypothetical protein
MQKGLFTILEKDDSETSKAKELFNFFAESLGEYGAEVGTGHKRIIIPKEMLPAKVLEEQLGFVPVGIAIPEAGQTQQTSYRHPDKLYHLHHHGEVWTMHADEHAASTM